MLTELKDLHPEGWRFIDGGWCHRPPWKRAINMILRAFQPQARKLVIFTRCVMPHGPERATARPRAIGYGFGLVRYRQ